MANRCYLDEHCPYIANIELENITATWTSSATESYATFRFSLDSIIPSGYTVEQFIATTTTVCHMYCRFNGVTAGCRIIIPERTGSQQTAYILAIPDTNRMVGVNSIEVFGSAQYVVGHYISSNS